MGGVWSALWTLAERYDYARHMAKQGKTVEDIAEKCRLTKETAICIVNKERCGEVFTLGQKDHGPT